MIVTWSNIRNKRAKYIERSTHADTLLHFHVGSNLIKRYMSRSFYHYLYIVVPCTFCKFSKTHQFFNLAYIGSIGQTSRAACITKGDSNIIFFADIKNLIIVFVERIFFSGHTHPCKYKTSATAYNIHFTFVFFYLFNRFTCNSAVKCDKVHTIFCVKTDNVDEVLRSQSCKISLIVDDTVVYRNSTDHSRTFMCQFLAEWLCVTVAR